MRVTNHMIFGNSMNNIWRNARHLNNLVTQIETGKRIQRPSDDPLLSSRSLRYRTILSETEQFLRNVHQGEAWMDVSEAAFNNILTGSPTNPSLMQRIYTRLVEGTQTGTQELSDQRAILTELRQYFNQMFGVDMNQTYLGRYVFSGFHTNQPPVLKHDWPGRSFIVSQFFDAQNIERAETFYRPNPTSMPQDITINVLKLPYTNVDFHFDTLGVIGNQPTGIFAPDGTPFTIVSMISTEEAAYRPPDDGLTIHHIIDTGELVFGDRVAADFRDGTRVTYEIRDLVAGELNPIVYFPTFEVNANTPADIMIVLDVTGTMIPARDAAHDAIRALMEGMPPGVRVGIVGYGAPGVFHVLDPTSDISEVENFLAGLTAPGAGNLEPGLEAVDRAINLLSGSSAENLQIIKITEAYSTSYPSPHTVESTIERLNEYGIVFNQLIPAIAGLHPDVITQARAMANATGGVYQEHIDFVAWDWNTLRSLAFSGQSFDTEGQNIQMEVSPNSYITVNSHARNILTADLYSDLRRLFDFADSLITSDPRVIEEYFSRTRTGDDLHNAVQQFLSDEKAFFAGMLHIRMNNMLETIMQHAAQAQREHTNLGSRMSRLELIGIRLEEDEVAYTDLLSQNEDTDLASTIMRKSGAEAAFGNALMSIARLTQLSLADFINR